MNFIDYLKFKFCKLFGKDDYTTINPDEEVLYYAEDTTMKNIDEDMSTLQFTQDTKQG